MRSGRRNTLFFVSHLEERDRPSSGMRYEIQVLNAEGQAIASGHVDDRNTSLEIDGLLIPVAVIDAARRQTIGDGDYVDAAGNSTSPF